MENKKIVYLPEDIAEVGKNFLLDHGYDVVVGSDGTEETAAVEGAEAEAVLVRLTPFTEKSFAAMPKLQIVARHGVGYDNVDLAEAKKNNVWVTNTPLANANAVAETILTLILAECKRLPEAVDAMKENNYAYRTTHLGQDLAGKTIGIVGYGKIGRALVKLLSGFDVELLIYDPFVTEVEFGKMVTRDELLAQSDYVSLHVPVTPETQHSFGQNEFQLMKNSAVLINAARGSLINEDDLVTALRTGRIRRAVLDVFENEPLPEDHPFLQLPESQLMLTPHIAANTVQTMERTALMAAQEIHRVLSGQLPKWPVQER